jgi:hypothetical protein
MENFFPTNDITFHFDKNFPHLQEVINSYNLPSVVPESDASSILPMTIYNSMKLSRIPLLVSLYSYH